MFWTIIAALVLQLQVLGREPGLPDQWEQATGFLCGNQRLQVAGFGAVRPFAREVSLEVNGQPVIGPDADRLRRDLASPRAVYRLTARRPLADGQIWLLISVGEKPRTGEVSYRSGSATFVNGRLVEYTGLELSSASSFWFR